MLNPLLRSTALAGLGLALALHSSLLAATYEVAQQHPQASDDGSGTAEHPWKTIAKAAEKVAPGDLVVIRGGTYRERVVVKSSGTAQAPIRFEAGPGEHVVVSGADRLTGWQKASPVQPVYHVPWSYQFNQHSRTMTHPDDEYYRVIGRSEQVAINHYLLRQVLDASQMGPGAFFADVTNRWLLVWDTGGRDLNKTMVEASVRQELLRVEGEHVQVRGLRFRYAANMAQHGAVVLAGHHDVLEDCVIEAMNASGATFVGEDQIVRRCVFRDNGQLGFGASHAHHLLFSECLVENNNVKDFERGWEAGGDKLVLCREAVLERSRFVRNRGCGVWFDIGNENCVVRQCLIADNEDSGIFYEISYGLHAQDNVIVGNGFAPTAGAWGAQAGIALSSSPDCMIERNLIFGNREGFNFREQTRTTPTIDRSAERPVWNHDQLIRHNLIAFNRDAQVWGWFDLKDNRHWPAARSAQTGATTAAEETKPADLAGAYVAKNDAGQPQDLTLEKLRLRFEQNVYCAAPGRGGFNWGVAWARHKYYATLAEFQSDLGVDHGGQVLDPKFADPLQLDFRLRAEVMTQLHENYPQGSVPGVILGIKP